MNRKKKLQKVGEQVKKEVNNTIAMPAKKVTEIGDNIVKTISKPFIQDKRKLTLGQRTADALAVWAGSWIFIIGFFIFLSLWMATNIYAWINTWDPYPFILLNLVLSCLAAIQAPVILMSQNRANQRDRMRAEYDYGVNRKAEKEIQEMILQLNRIEDKLGKKRKK